MTVKFDLSPLLSACSNLQYRQLSHIVHLSKTDTWGRFPFRQNFLFDRFKCKWYAQFDWKFSGTNGHLLKNSPFSVPTGWNRNSRSICAILFRPAFGDWNFQFLPVSVVQGQSQFFFFSFLILSFKMASARPMLERWEDFHVKCLVSCW